MVKISFIIPTYLRPDALKKKISEINLFEKEEVEFIFVIESLTFGLCIYNYI